MKTSTDSTVYFTPGPWRVSREDGRIIVKSCEPAPRTIATGLRRMPHLIDGAESEANAALIAAAPDLLEACAKLIELRCVHEMLATGCDYNNIADALHAGRAAIAKATTRQ